MFSSSGILCVYLCVHAASGDADEFVVLSDPRPIDFLCVCQFDPAALVFFNVKRIQ